MIYAMISAALALAPAVVETPASQTDHWAVLIAGSAGYGNYRHQADVCHAYQIVAKAGIPKEQIIVLAEDDIANSPENPFPGQLFNKPTDSSTPGVDVYAGCNIDYSGMDVTPENFVNVLTGQSQAMQGVGSGKVLKSNSNSRVFVNFVDHGGVNIIGFPRTTMHASDLVAALQKMHDTQMYKELVFYLEACESGSMFATLPTDIQIYATTAANAKESSWGTYCPPDDMVNGKSLNSCLGDLYSVKWMEDSDTNIASGETLAAQFTRVQQETNKSHVQQFGDTSIASSEPTSNFQGSTDQVNRGLHMTLLNPAAVEPASRKVQKETTSLPSADAELASAYARFMATDSKKAARELIAGINDRLLANERFEKIALRVTGKKATGVVPEQIDNACHYKAHKAYIAKCGEWTTGALKHSATLAEMCAATRGDAAPVISAIHSACYSA
jgi:legumain